MTAHAEAGPAEAVAPRPTGAGRVRQITTLVRRNLTHIKRQPEMLTDVTIQPVMFVLLFAYVFGGSIQIPGVDWADGGWSRRPASTSGSQRRPPPRRGPRGSVEGP